MEIQTQTYDDLYYRLGKLERQNWWLKAFGLLLIIVFLVSTVIFYFSSGFIQAKPTSHIVKAEKFIVVDQQGRTKAILGNILKELQQTSKQDPYKDLSVVVHGLLLMGQDDKPRLCLAFGDDLSEKNQEGHFLVFLDQNLKKRIEIINQTNESGIHIFDEDEKFRAGLRYSTILPYKSGEKMKTSSISVRGDSSSASLTTSYRWLGKESLKSKKAVFGEVPDLTLSCGIFNKPGPSLSLEIDEGKYPLLNMEKNIGSIEDKKAESGLRFINEGKILVGFDDSDTPSIKLFDEKQHLRATIGSADLVKKTGTQLKTPLSSMVFFNEKGNVIWKAPLE